MDAAQHVRYQISKNNNIYQKNSVFAIFTISLIRFLNSIG